MASKNVNCSRNHLKKMSELSDSAYGNARKSRLLFSTDKLPTFVLGMVEWKLVLDLSETMIGIPSEYLN